MPAAPVAILHTVEKQDASACGVDLLFRIYEKDHTGGTSCHFGDIWETKCVGMHFVCIEFMRKAMPATSADILPTVEKQNVLVCGIFSPVSVLFEKQ